MKNNGNRRSLEVMKSSLDLFSGTKVFEKGGGCNFLSRDDATHRRRKLKTDAKVLSRAAVVAVDAAVVVAVVVVGGV